MGGYRLRGEGRVYLPKKQNRYFAVGASFRHLIIRDIIPLGVEGVENEFGQQEFAFFMNTPFVFHRFNTNLDFKYGFQKELKKNVFLDFYLGLSIRNINVQSNTELPNGTEIPELRGFWTLRDNHKLKYPIPIFGFKVGLS